MIGNSWGKLMGAICLTALAALAAAQGPLVPPPGPIAPTGRSLEEIQPRRTIDTIPFRITADGVYHVTKNLQALPGQGGIVIDDAVDYVEIDLGGFTLRGPGDGSGIGLLLPAVQKVREAAARMECRNGNIVGFGVGIQLGLQSSPTPSAHAYLKYELKNVMISSYSVSGVGVQVLMADGSVRFISSSIVGCGGDGLQINPVLQDFHMEACDVSHNAGNGINFLPAVQTPGPNNKIQHHGGGGGAGKVSMNDISFSFINDNGLNGLVCMMGDGSVVPTESFSLNFSKVEFNRNGQNGFQIENTSASRPMEQLSLNFEEIKFRGNGQNGFVLRDNRSVGDPIGGQVSFDDFIASNNGAEGILIGLLLPAVQKVREAAGAGPHVKVFNGNMDNNGGNGFNGKGVAELTCRKAGGKGNEFYAYKLENCLVSSFQHSSATDNGQGGMSIIAILIGLFEDSQFNGNGGHGVSIQGGGQITFTGLECHENTGNGVQCDGSVINMSQCKMTKNTMNGASLMKMKGSKILQNVFSGNAGGGLSITDGTSNTIMMNELSVNGGTGVAIADGTRNTIHDNTIMNNATGVSLNMAGNFVFRNILANTANMSFVLGNEVAPTQNVTNPTTSPWANIVPTPPE